MEDAMITARISSEKKAAGNAILERANLTPSQAIGLLYDRLISEGSANFLVRREISPNEWRAAAEFVDSIYIELDDRFKNMTRKEARIDRLKSKGLL